MHEISLITDLVEECERQAGDAQIKSVSVRHATTIPQDMLHEVWGMVTVDRSIASAQLKSEAYEAHLNCEQCGFNGVLGHDDVVGHMSVCPQCSNPTEFEHAAEIELIGVETV